MTPAETAQALFEATFPKGYTPKIDVRTPEDIAEQKILENWK